MKIRSWALVAVLVIFCSMAEARTYKIGMLHWVGFSPNNVAEVKGFWKAQGIDVTVVNLANTQELYNAFINKRVDIGHEMIGTWYGIALEKDLPVKIIAELDWSNGGDRIIIKKDIDISQIKGQIIGVYGNNLPICYLLNKYLKQNQMRLTDINRVELDTEGLTDQFIANRLPLIVNYDPQAIRAERQGNGRVAATSADYPGCMPEGYAILADTLKEISKDDLIKIFRGWLEAVTWLKNEANWEEYRKILNEKTFEGETPYSDEDLKLMLNAVSIHDVETLRERNKPGAGLFVYLEELKSMLKENNMLKKDFKTEEIFDTTGIMEALK